VWLDPANLVSAVRGELDRRKKARGSATLDPGERVRINPGAKRPSRKDPTRTVWPFPVVEFENGVPVESAEEFLLATGTEAGDEGEAASQPEQADDDIPF
jgi:hypothetical protein